MLIVYAVVCILLSLYSYALIDPNLTFFQTKWWELFREIMISLGYYHRDTSWIYYLVLVGALFLFHFYFVKNYRKLSLSAVSIMVGFITLFAYPFLSHDFFNYMFDARIATWYHQNPYIKKAMDFPADPWLRFMHWTHRVYPYGPVFLLLTLLPSALSFGKFALDFFLFKALWMSLYLIGVLVLAKQDKKSAVIFATHPLVIVEGLIANHNDLLGVCLVFIAYYFILKKKKFTSFFFLIGSIGIKYTTLPVIFRLARSTVRFGFMAALLLLTIYVSFGNEIQPWYFLLLLAFLPEYKNVIGELAIFFAGLLLSYFPYIRFGGWDTAGKVLLKHEIIIVFLFMNILYLLIKNYQRLNRAFLRR
ncbi:hypothetical protein HY214_02210 [Candidatus Roizmanbacteria bacterium]|nr:hypothetical protein [Candidatus Roizmanbacteria bacterium]